MRQWKLDVTWVTVILYGLIEPPRCKPSQIVKHCQFLAANVDIQVRASTCHTLPRDECWCVQLCECLLWTNFKNSAFVMNVVGFMVLHTRRDRQDSHPAFMHGLPHDDDLRDLKCKSLPPPLFSAPLPPVCSGATAHDVTAPALRNSSCINPRLRTSSPQHDDEAHMKSLNMPPSTFMFSKTTETATLSNSM